MKIPKKLNNIKIKYLDILKVLRINKESSNQNLDEVIQNTDNLLTQVENPSELVLDAKVSYESTSQASTIFLKNCMEDKITTEQFVSFYGKKQMKEYVKFMYRKFYGVNFLEKFNLFTIEKVRTQRTQGIIRRSQRTDPKTPDLAIEITEDENQLNVVKKIKKILREYEEIDYFTLVLDPHSFSRTIENLFYLSFAVKMQQVFLKMNDNKLLVVKENETDDDLLSHLIVSIEFNEYRKLIKNLNIKEPMIK